MEEGRPRLLPVLQALDATLNANHAALVGLAAAGVLRAVVTTNFDCLLKRALDARQTPYRVYATAESFDALPAVVRSPAPEGLPLIKAHGSVTDPSSMVDTLAQRVAGRPKALEESIAALLEQYPCLMLGFSGADLAYDPDYLGLRPAAGRGGGLCALVLPGDKPRPPMRKLLDAWGPRGSEVEGSLPKWLAARRPAWERTRQRRRQTSQHLPGRSGSPNGRRPGSTRWARCRR